MNLNARLVNKQLQKRLLMLRAEVTLTGVVFRAVLRTNDAQITKGHGGLLEAILFTAALKKR